MAVSLSMRITEGAYNLAANTSPVTVSVVATWSYGSYNATGLCTGSITIDGASYSFSGIKFNTGQTTYGSQTIMTKTATVTHNADGSKTVACSAAFNTRVSSGWVYASGSLELATIPRQATITAAPNFNDEDNPTITYTNPAGDIVESLRACISFTGAKADIAYRAISKTGNSYTFNLTEAERNILRNGTTTTNSRTVRFYVETVIGDQTLRNNVEKTLTIVNANPTLTPAVTDSNAAMVALTGDANKLVKYYSNASASATYSALKGASITSYKVVCGGTTKTTIPATFSAVESGEFTFSVTDSRGNTTTKTVTKTLVNYVKLSCNLGNDKPTAEGTITLTASGNVFNGSFGAVANTLTVQYRHKAQDGEYGDWQAMTATLSGNTYTAEAHIAGLDYRVAHTFHVKAVDKVCDCTSVERTVRVFPVFDWSGEDFNFNVPVTFSAGAIGLDHTHDAGDIVGGALPIARGGTGATTAGEALANLGGVSLTLLWENASPSSNFGNQTLTMDLAGYDEIMLITTVVPGVSDIGFGISKVGYRGRAMCFQIYTDSAQGVVIYGREFTPTANGITIGQATYKVSNVAQSACYFSDAYMIPLKIYGIKGATA